MSYIYSIDIRVHLASDYPPAGFKHIASSPSQPLWEQNSSAKSVTGRQQQQQQQQQNHCAI